MIVGVGVDLVTVSRIRKALEDAHTGKRFLDRVFTSEESRYCESRKRGYESYAARFAAKEAAMKALGVGWGRYAGWREIEVIRGPGGKPSLRLTGKAEQRARKLGIESFALSLTHEPPLAMAQVIAEGWKKEGAGES
jgi:holo-[acyl-carrier protein] synthase